METELMRSDDSVYALAGLFQPPEAAAARQVVQSKLFMRTDWELSGRAAFILDQFSDAPGASCCFVRLPLGPARIVRLVVDGAHTLESCRSGGWLVKSADGATFSYWIPQSPVLRTIDSRGRNSSEGPASVVAVRGSSADAPIEIEARPSSHIDFPISCLSPP